jgi:hypothetical protein
MSGGIPDFLTHYYLPGRSPFLSISYLEGAELEKVIEELREMCERGEFRRGYADWYIEERKVTEEFLRSEFQKKGGVTELVYPHYFVLGSSNMQKNMAPGTKEIRINLHEIPKEYLSFTYPDSVASRVLCKDETCRKPFHGQVFTLDEIVEIVNEYGFPEDKVEVVDGIRFPLFIEAQLWSGEPIKRFLEAD